MRIAIADDQPADIEILQQLIRRWAQEEGIFPLPTPTVFASGEALLAAFTPGDFDIIFLDIYMTGMTGMETAKKLRARDGACHLIFTTTSTEFAVDSYAVAAAYYLVKPLTYEKLVRALTRCQAKDLEQRSFVMVPCATWQQPLLLVYSYFCDCMRGVLVNLERRR